MIRAFSLFFLLTCALAAQSTAKLNLNSRIASDAPLSADDRWSLFVRNNFASPGAFFQVAGPAFGQTMGNTPEEWGRNAGGFGRRAGLNFVTNVSQSAIHSSTSAALGFDPRYQRCDCKGGMKRLGHAFAGIVLSADSTGQRGFNPSNLMGAYGAGFIGAAMFPERYSIRVKGLQQGHQQLGGLAFGNIFQEFQPEITRFFRRTILRKR
jgi:hypothetical protein